MGFSPYILSYFETSYEFKTKRFILDYLRAFMGKYDVLTLFYLLPHVKLTTTKYCTSCLYFHAYFDLSFKIRQNTWIFIEQQNL